MGREVGISVGISEALDSRSKSKWYKAQKVQKYASNSQIQALQILTNDDEVENWSLSSFLLAVRRDFLFSPRKGVVHKLRLQDEVGR